MALGFTLTACSVNIKNEPPADLTASLANAHASGAQQQSIDMLFGEIGALEQAVYEERAAGSDYSPRMRDHLKKLIVLNRTLAGETFEFYEACVRASGKNLEPRRACKAFAEAVFRLSRASDELHQLALVYTYAGLEWNPGALTKRNEVRINELIDATHRLADELEGPTLDLAAVLTDCCNEVPEYTSHDPQVVFPVGENDTTEALAEAVSFASTGTILERYPTTITVSVSKLEEQGAASAVGHAATLFLFFYPGSGGDGVVSASISIEGGAPIDFTIDTFDINAKDPAVLRELVANRIVGAAISAVIDTKMAEL